MKKALTICIDDCVEGIEEICATFIQRKATGSTRIHMVNVKLYGRDWIYLPWNGDPKFMKEESE